ncbi:hypothetical protein Sjap_003126 [Stephania japonica]|uniref:tryptophan synthase n=1 Tax=Stephania japonica TaxID=461633 RepID=A0AAP0KN50_9MAGN
MKRSKRGGGVDNSGKFGKYVPETLISCLGKLEAKCYSAIRDAEFQDEGPELYLKREDLNHEGAHKINNVIAQVMLAKRMGRTSIVAATGAGQHGGACAKLALDCTIFMGTQDMQKQSFNVSQMKLLGAQVESVR